MKEEKRRRLESAGWKVSSAADFLGLTAEEEALVELKLRLATWLRTARARRNWTQTEFARRIGSSQSRVAKMEAGDPSVSLDLMFRSAFAAGATQRDLGRFIAAREKAVAPTRERGQRSAATRLLGAGFRDTAVKRHGNGQPLHSEQR
jgi:transcriptional regulator with XRE-family HTH domain